MTLRNADALLKLSRCFNNIASHRYLGHIILGSSAYFSAAPFCSRIDHSTSASATQHWLPSGGNPAQHDGLSKGITCDHQLQSEAPILGQRLRCSPTRLRLSAAQRLSASSTAQRTCSTTAASSTSSNDTTGASGSSSSSPTHSTTSSAQQRISITYPQLQTWAAQRAKGQLPAPSSEERQQVAALLHAFSSSKALQNTARQVYINVQVSVRWCATHAVGCASCCKAMSPCSSAIDEGPLGLCWP